MPALIGPVVIRSRLGQAWDVTSDVLIATALIWTLPLMLGAAAAAIIQNFFMFRPLRFVPFVSQVGHEHCIRKAADAQIWGD